MNDSWLLVASEGDSALVVVHEEWQKAPQLLLVTGQRRGEVNSAKWSHFDLLNKCWAIPFENSRNRKEHKVPLSALALSLIEELVGFRTIGEWVFPLKDGINPMTERVISRAANRAQEALGIEKWVPHDLRRAAATHMANQARLQQVSLLDSRLS